MKYNNNSKIFNKYRNNKIKIQHKHKKYINYWKKLIKLNKD